MMHIYYTKVLHAVYVTQILRETRNLLQHLPNFGVTIRDLTNKVGNISRGADINTILAAFYFVVPRPTHL